MIKPKHARILAYIVFALSIISVAGNALNFNDWLDFVSIVVGLVLAFLSGVLLYDDLTDVLKNLKRKM